VFPVSRLFQKTKEAKVAVFCGKYGLCHGNDLPFLLTAVLDKFFNRDDAKTMTKGKFGKFCSFQHATIGSKDLADSGPQRGFSLKRSIP
jgi:hypothetical protein